jgi:hypothetical protein
LERLRKICISKGYTRGRGKRSRTTLYDVILSMDDNLQNAVINAARREIAKGNTRYARRSQAEVPTTEADAPERPSIVNEALDVEVSNL